MIVKTNAQLLNLGLLLQLSGTIVENSTEGLERDLAFSKEVSKNTGVHIVAGTGFYIADMQAANHLHNTTEELYNHMLQELTVGCVEEPEIKAGFMGEIASVWPLRGKIIFKNNIFVR